MRLGSEASFTRFPAPLILDGLPYYLVRNPQGYLLLSAVCPHRGAEIVDWGGQFMCPYHGWRFEKNFGNCVNGPNSRMFAVPVVVRDGELHVDAELPPWGKE